MTISSIEIGIGLLFFIASALHTSLGFGGGSSYSAIQASFGFNSVFLKGNSLLCNILASGINIVQHLRKGTLYYSKGLLYTLPALPFVFWGSSIKTNETIYLIVLGVFLISCVILRLTKPIVELSIPVIILISAMAGFISGYVGIGGGILLAPFVVSKVSPRESTSVTSIFIFLNSGIGFITHVYFKDFTPNIITFMLPGFVLLGTLLGNYIGFTQFFQKRMFLFLNGFLFAIGIVLIYKGV